MGTLEFPFSFGGDGATLLIPDAHCNAVLEKLAGLKALARDNFDLHLRVGAVPLQQIREDGFEVQVARYEMTDGKTVGIFRGDGATHAEQLIREHPETYGVEASDDVIDDLEGLSCRWKPIPSQNGVVLSLLVKARGEEVRPIYQDVLTELNRLFDGGLDRANPVNLSELVYQSILDCFRREKQFSRSIFSIAFLSRFFEILMAVAIFKWNFNPLFFDPKHYKEALATHSDFRKFDDVLRMTIDCTSEQADHIEEFLSTMHEQRKLFYGTYRSDSALMTCYVENLQDGEHIHFIDGAGGGYTRASIMMKQQIQRAKQAASKTTNPNHSGK